MVRFRGGEVVASQSPNCSPTAITGAGEDWESKCVLLLPPKHG